MAATLTASLKLFSFLKDVEGYRSKPYKDTGSLNSSSIWTCGWGHTLPGNKKPPECTPELAEQWLKEDVAQAEASIKNLVKVELNQHEHDALVSFVFNIGESKLQNTNTIAALNKGHKQKFADYMMQWNKVRVDGVLIPSSGLNRRRLREREMFLKGVY